MDIFSILKELQILPTEDALTEIEKLSQEEKTELCRKLMEEKPVFLDGDFVKSVKKPKIEVMEFSSYQKEVTIEEFIEILNEYFDFLSERVKRKMNPLRLASISSLKDNEYYGVIGMVKSVKQKEHSFLLEIEDKTGSVKINVNRDFFPEDKPLINDVVGVEGIYRGKVIEAEKIIYPEVEVSGTPPFEKETVLYARNDDSFLRIVINGKFWSVAQPAIFRIDGIEVLVFPNKGVHPVSILKRRNLQPGRVNLSLLLRSSPHLVITQFSPSLREEFNGVKIFGLRSKEEVRIKLKTLEEVL